MKRKIVEFLRKLERKIDPPFSHVQNFDTYWAVCSYEPSHGIGTDFDKMVKELSKRSGFSLEDCRKVYEAEDSILEDLGLLH